MAPVCGRCDLQATTDGVQTLACCRTERNPGRPRSLRGHQGCSDSIQQLSCSLLVPPLHSFAAPVVVETGRSGVKKADRGLDLCQTHVRQVGVWVPYTCGAREALQWPVRPRQCRWRPLPASIPAHPIGTGVGVGLGAGHWFHYIGGRHRTLIPAPQAGHVLDPPSPPTRRDGWTPGCSTGEHAPKPEGRGCCHRHRPSGSRAK